MQNIFLVVGLGNPGLKFKKTRHNIGFRVLDAFQKVNNFSHFKLIKKLRVKISRGFINGQEVLLAKPQTYMNRSGDAIKSLMTNGQLEIGNLVVIHDDFDLLFGKLKIVQDSSSGGHHGVQSIIQALGTKNFKRIKIGIRPIAENDKRQISAALKAEDFVLKKFNRVEKEKLKEVFEKACAVLAQIINKQRTD